MPDGEKRVATENGETLRDFPPPPPKPAEKEVVRNIEVLCQYIAKVGHDFENLARVKEAGNPQFSFLFGGEPGSAAAIGHEYFQWMKRKCCSEPNLSQETKENNMSQQTKENCALSRPLIAGTSSDVLSIEREGSPAVSDMDMEEDDDLAYGNNSNKASTEEPLSRTNEKYFLEKSLQAPQSTTERLIPEGAVSSNISSVATSSLLHDGKDDNDLPFIEDVSPVKATQSPTVSMKDESPFRLIEGYSSDGSGENDRRECAGDITEAMASTSALENVLGPGKDKDLELESTFNVKGTVSGSKIQAVSGKSSTMISETAYDSSCPPKASSPIFNPSQGNNIVEVRRIEGDHRDEKVQLEGAQGPSILKVDEFGRLVREGVSDSESDGAQYGRRGGKRVRRRRSRSPHESRQRRRTHNSRKRLDRSCSSSPRRGRSKSPPSFRRADLHSKRERDQRPECSNFIRGRCFLGTSCRLLHCDSGQQRNKLRNYKDSHQDSVEYSLHETTQVSEALPNVSPQKSMDGNLDQKITISTVKDQAPKDLHRTEESQDLSNVSEKREEGTKDLFNSSHSIPTHSGLSSTQSLQAIAFASVSDSQNVQNLLPASQPVSDHASSALPNQGRSSMGEPPTNYSLIGISAPFSSDRHRLSTITGDFNSESTHPPRHMWPNLPPPPLQPPLQFLQNSVAPPGPFHSVESFHQLPMHIDEYKGRAFPIGYQKDQALDGKDRFFHPPNTGGSHIPHQSFLRENASVPFPEPGSGSFSRDNIVHPPLPFSESRTLPFALQQPSYGQQPLAGCIIPSGSSMVDPPIQRMPSSFLESNFLPHVVNMPKSSIMTRYNPYASTFEQTPSSLKIISDLSGQADDAEYKSKYNLSSSSGPDPVCGPSSRSAATPPDLRLPIGHLPRPVDYVREVIGDILPNVPRQSIPEPAPGALYDPLADSIELSINTVKKLGLSKEQNLHTEAEENIKQKGRLLTESEADELGEVASPLPSSPGVAGDAGNSGAGEIETIQVGSPEKRKKSKDSRSMKLFKIALAGFVKELLKPSWRQGNMSKEAFKTIVKKTVDKVSGAMPSHQIPKTQAKINHYVESSQRKLTKLVMGYVDKYVKI
ncbi:uncharacterized protein LOC109721104 [Ananas comosus]|uniref:Uncharacterized protein LOC109721104 n=1 Tax=Ananas comosus TaxID=4615 RepID=A0A6P5GFH1_ANACO|nr:uncharacterized protein LOC109721104 [Ananas comosus]